MEVDNRCGECAILDCSCTFCYKKFVSNLELPKTLPCNHLFCFLCLKKLVEEYQFSSCPRCGIPITEPAEWYPYNQIFLDVDRAFMSTEPLSFPNSCGFHSLKRALVYKKMSLTANLKTVRTLINNLEIYQKADEVNKKNIFATIICLIRKLKTSESNYTNSKNSASAIMEQVLGTANFETERDPSVRNVSSMSVIDAASNNEQGATRLITFPSFRTSVEDIIVLLQNEKKVFVHKKINGIEKFGRITLEYNMLQIHSLTMTDMPKVSALLKFNDLLDNTAFGLFLKLRCTNKGVNRLVALEMVSSPYLEYFVGFCTGILGQSYKGMSFTGGTSSEYDEVVKVENIHYNSGYINNYLSIEKQCMAPKVVVQWTGAGGFKICDVKYGIARLKDIVATVTSPFKSKFIDYTNASLKITDCGLLYTF